MSGTIALVTCGSNFERHRNVISALRDSLRRYDFSLSVITNYGVFIDGMEYDHGEPAVYQLLRRMEIAGCILEANLGSDELVAKIAEILQSRNIPFITINLEASGAPFVHLDVEKSGRELIRHLLDTHHAHRINLVMNAGHSVVRRTLAEVWRQLLTERGLPVDERRVQDALVALDNGGEIYDEFARRGVADAQAYICIHDVSAISLCKALEERNIRVPEDAIVCSMNHSDNSASFVPDITGVDRVDAVAADTACRLLIRKISGEEIPRENYYAGVLCLGSSCGCAAEPGSSHKRIFRWLTENKINAGKQISSMMRFNDSIDSVSTLSHLADSIGEMMEGIGCRNYFCCLNRGDLEYIMNDRPDPKDASSPPYEDVLTVLQGRCDGKSFNGQEFTPVLPAPVALRPGDMLITFPIHHLNRDYGFMTFLNETIPIEQYNYRICQESIGTAIENLHTKIILRENARELEELHMTDQMTGLRNRFALVRFRDRYLSAPSFTVCLLDMDGLKQINDHFGHLSGNHALCVIADALRDMADPEDLLIRYGGDEFLILSLRSAFWEGFGSRLNARLRETVRQQRLPYPLGVSFGRADSAASGTRDLSRLIELADQDMYRNKQSRKQETV